MSSSYGSSGPSQPPETAQAPSPRDRSPTFASLSAAAMAATTTQLPQEGHKRVYQACIPCRRRKVRCDLGSVDNPHDPPCVRCRRESKECYFSATRRKRKTDDDNNIDATDYVIRNGRRKLRADDEPAGQSLDRGLYNEIPLTPGSAAIRSQPLRRPAPSDTARSSHSRRDGSVMAQDGGTGNDSGNGNGTTLPADELNTPLENLEARSVMRREVYGPHDALDLLYKAATDRFVDGGVEVRSKAGANSSSPHGKPDDENSGPPVPSGLKYEKRGSRDPSYPASRYDPAGQPYSTSRSSYGAARTEQSVDPTLSQDNSSAQPGYAEAVQLWTRFRFVRAGWFTAQEAIEYIDYYYKYLSPLTPISPPTFNNPASHVTLLNEEPILAVTLLTIASRYKTLAGPGGTCRSHAIHEQLWTYLRGMIERVVWGQEAFGGGFCGSGADESQTSSTAPWRGLRKGSLRTLGTIESLMVLTEWHPRALHFPPAEVTDELLLPGPESHVTRTATTAAAAAAAAPSIASTGLAGLTAAAAAADPPPLVGVGGKRIDSWLEPAWRSDRMCWMLLSTAMGLAYELGVFDDIDELLAAGAITRPEYEEETYRLRANRIKRLLLIYLTQLAGRLGWTSMVPESLRKRDPASSRRRPVSAPDGQTPGTSLSSVSNAFNYIPDLELDDQIIHCWVGISNAMHAGNEKLFRSRKHTTEIIQSGSYIELLKDFQPLLRDWWKEFERFRLPTFIRHILTIEYEYVRIYVNSLSLQAVVERCTSNAGHSASSGSSSLGASAPQLSPQTQNYFGKLPLGQLGGFGLADQEYVKEVVDGCRNLLRTVVDGLLPGGYLKHAPVRTYFRIISGAMFLLKTFALGAPKADVEVSIALMDRTVNALRNCVVDDVHLGTRFADLLESLTSRLRNRFIHAPAPMPPPEGRSPVPPPYDADSHVPPQVHGHGHGPGPAPPAPAAENDMAWSRVPNLDRTNAPTNISATPFDPAGGNFPYLSGAASVPGPSTPAATGVDSSALGDQLFDGGDWNNHEMWYLPAGPAFFQNMGDSNVAMTAEGVSVAGMDLLDFMAMDPPSVLPRSMDGNSF